MYLIRLPFVKQTKVDSAHREWENQMALLRKTHKQEMDNQIQKYENNRKQSEERLLVAEEKVTIIDYLTD